MRRAIRIAAWSLGGLLLLAGGLVATAAIAVNSGILTPRLAAAIEAATGRRVTLGAVSLRPGLVPRLAVKDAVLANAPGGSQPQMARIRQLEAKLALLPLLRGEIAFARITLDGAEILLELLPDGTPNWALRPLAPAENAAGAAEAASHSTAPPRRVVIGELVLTGSTIAAPGMLPAPVTIEHLTVGGIGGRGPVAATARLVLAGTAVALAAETGPIPPPPGAPRPLRARAEAGANALSAGGVLGGALRLAASFPEPAALTPLLAAFAPGIAAPPVLPPIEASLTLGPDWRPSDLRLGLGAADLGALRPGLALRRLEARAEALDHPLDITAEAAANGLPLALTARLDPVGALLASPPGSAMAVTAEARGGGARASLAGRIGAARQLRGLALEARLAAPDAAALAPLLPVAPAGELTLEAHLAAPDGLDGPVRLGPFRVVAPALRAEGDATWRPGRPPSLEARLAAARIDLDALGAGARSARATTPAPPPATAPASDSGRVIPDIPLPIDLARAFAGRIEIAADHLILAGMDWRALRATLTLAEGGARLAPFTVVTPGGPVRGEASLDAAATPPALALALRSEEGGLDLAALQRARGEAPAIEGRAEIRIELRGRGATSRAVAATLTGEAGLAMVGGRLAGPGMLRLSPELLGLLLPGAPPGGVEIRCLALRASAEEGIVKTPALLLETSIGRIEGAAVVHLATEALAARLRSDVNLFGVRVRAPIGIGGTLAAPRLGVEPDRAAAEAIGGALGGRLGRDPTVAWLRGQASGVPPAGDCAAQLRLARFGADGPAPPAPPVIPGAPRAWQGTAQDVLRGLGGLLGGRR